MKTERRECGTGAKGYERRPTGEGHGGAGSGQRAERTCQKTAECSPIFCLYKLRGNAYSKQLVITGSDIDANGHNKGRAKAYVESL